MTDRWNPKRTTVAVDPPHNRIVVPGDAGGGSPVEPRGKSWGIRVRGDTGGTVKHVYRCPVHGEFEAMVPRAEVPDAMPCAEECESPWNAGDSRENDTCGRSSPWAGSRCGIGHASGEVMS